MARKSSPLIIPPDDLSRLEQLLQHADDTMKERIQIVMTCAKEPSNKKVAEALRTNEHKVAKWKEAYREKGISGLQSSHGGGREAKVKVDNLEELVLQTINKTDEELTIHSLAQSLGCSDYQISNVLSRNNISLARKHMWAYTTLDTLHTSDVEVVGVYLSSETCIVVTCYSRYGMITEPGIAETQDRSFWDRLKRSPAQVSLPNLIVESGNYTESAGSCVAANDYLKTFAAKMNNVEDITWHAFIFSKTHYTFEHIFPAELVVECYEDLSEWEYQIHSWLGARTTGLHLYELEILQKILRAYIESSSKGREPLVWAKSVTQTGTASAPIEYISYEEPMEWSVGEKGEDQLDSLLSSDGTLKCGFVAFVADEKRVIYKTIESSSMAQPDQFDYSSKEGLMKGFNQIESPIIQLRDQAGIAMANMYLDSVKKKLNIRGIMKPVTYESELGRGTIMVPLSVADSMKPKERLKTVGYRKAICKGIQVMSYQKATDNFNSSYHRTGTPMELSKLTYAEDIEQEGRDIRLAKIETARTILIERGFDPVTTMYSGGELPDEYRNKPCEFITINSEELNKQITPGWLNENNQMKEEPDYALPDLDVFHPEKKRRGKRIEVAPEKKEATCIRFLKWYNQEATRKTRGIIHNWRFEKSSEDVVYISIDAVFVDKQAETRQTKGEDGKPKKAVKKSKKTKEVKKEAALLGEDDDDNKRIGHVNIRIEYDNNRYLINSLDMDESYRELIAFLLYTKLCNKYIIFFIDGEQALADRINALFKNRWEYDLFLDWMHLQEKVYDRMSNIIKPGKVPDPRGNIVYYKRGPKAGQIKKQDTIARSQLFARELLRILWVGNIQEAIDFCESLKTKDVVQHPKELEKLITYLKNKRDWITCYALRKKAGLRNSSNGVEGENRLLVADRQKHNGTAWRPNGSGNVAAVTCLFQNREEDAWFYENKIPFCMPERAVQ